MERAVFLMVSHIAPYFLLPMTIWYTISAIREKDEEKSSRYKANAVITGFLLWPAISIYIGCLI